MKDRMRNTRNILIFIFSLYLFLLSIQGIGSSIGFFGKDFARALISTTSVPMLGLIIGIFVTSVTQSSSCTTSITVGLVSAGAISLEGSIPIIMGANIGTSVTNILVSMGMIGNKSEFRRAFGGAIVHDFFNLFCVILLFPLEVHFHLIQKTAEVFSGVLEGVGGIKIASPLKLVTKPAESLVLGLIQIVTGEGTIMSGVIGIIVFLAILFFSLSSLSRTMKMLIIGKVQNLMHSYIFANPARSLILGLMLTAVIQSSSVTTSLIVPLVGAGILNIYQIYPYILGANLGTTVTAFLAALATGNPLSVTAAMSHFTFNLTGILIFYPLKAIPISLALWFSGIVTKKRFFAVLYVILFFFIIPLLLLLFFN